MSFFFFLHQDIPSVAVVETVTCIKSLEWEHCISSRHYSYCCKACKINTVLVWHNKSEDIVVNLDPLSALIEFAKKLYMRDPVLHKAETKCFSCILENVAIMCGLNRHQEHISQSFRLHMEYPRIVLL